MLETRGQNFLIIAIAMCSVTITVMNFDDPVLLALSLSFSDLKVFRTVGEVRLTISKRDDLDRMKVNFTVKRGPLDINDEDGTNERSE